MINGFFGPHRYLSNFWYATICDLTITGPFVHFDGGTFQTLPLQVAETVEHAFQALKADNSFEFADVVQSTSPAEAKAKGRGVSMWSNWDDIRVSVMEQLVTAKFEQNEELAIMLCDTNNSELIEGNTWGDCFWGVCKGVGENHLGKILMRVRSNIQVILGDIIDEQALRAAFDSTEEKLASNPYVENSFRWERWNESYANTLARVW